MKISRTFTLPPFLSRLIFPKIWAQLTKEATYLHSIGREGRASTTFRHPIMGAGESISFEVELVKDEP